MALVNCPECGKEVSDSTKTCIHCGYKLNKNNHLLDKTKRIDKRTLKKIIVGIVAVALCYVVATIIGQANQHPIEKQADEYIQEIKEIDDVKKINAVVCISNEVSGESNVPGYLIFYSTKTESELAYFFRGEYKGNGYNGEYLPNGSNLLTMGAAITALEFLDDNGLTEATGKRFYDVEEGIDGIAYINLIDIEGWIENY